MVLPIRFEKLTHNWSKNRCEFFIIYVVAYQPSSCTATKATFNVKDNIKIVKNISITLTINITTLPTKIRKIGGKTTSA